MPEPEPLIVLDSSVAFDLINGRLILELQGLPYGFSVPDILYVSEFNEKEKTEISKLEFDILEFDENQVAEVLDFKAAHSGPSVADWFAFIGAKDNQAILLTGDGALRQVAEEKGLTVHGTLWVLDELVLHTILIPGRAAHALREIIIKGSYLPRMNVSGGFGPGGKQESSGKTCMKYREVVYE